MDPSARPAPAASPWLPAGVGLMAVSLVLWLPLPVVPFLPLSMGDRALLGGSMLLGAELTFWLGAVLAGPETLRRGRRWLRERLRGGPGR